jgi:prolyl oligopeptidase
MPDTAPDLRPTLDAPDDDPYLWLEDVDGPAATAWVDAQSAATLARFAGPGFDADRDAIKALLDRTDRIASVTRRAGLLYNFWKDATQPRGLWRRTTPASYRTAAPEWEVLLDLDALAREENRDWVWQGAGTVPGTHDRAMLRLSDGGGDAVALREYDLPTRRFVPPGPAEDGFALPGCKADAAWLDRDTLLLSAALGEGMATRSGYARTVRLWRRGTDPLAAPVLFETSADSMAAFAQVDRTAGTERVTFGAQLGFFDTALHLGDRNGPGPALDLPTDMRVDWHGDWMALSPRTPWTANGTTHAPDSVLGIALSAFLAGEREVAVLFRPGERQALQGFFWSGTRLVISILDELDPVFLTATPSPRGWSQGRLHGLPAVGVVSVWPLDAQSEEGDGTLLARTEAPLTPATLLLLPAGPPGPDLPGPGPVAASPTAPVVLKQAPALFDAAGLVVTRHEARSVDGERIPYVQVGPAGETGDAPVHLSGYGGFGISVLPHYSGVQGRLWLERGGTTVLANIRGGAEFGTRWHDAGRREGKALSHEDFAAVAADLVRRGVTMPARIAAEGGSNGGLLIANMLTRFPERFGALFCTIPLIDMRRYSRLLAGASWIAEYGDPDAAGDWAFLRNISAYHAAVPGRRYPPILLATARRDDRVHPGHARKMAAKLQALGYEAHLYETAAGGHGYGKDNAEIAAFSALGAAFLRRAIGWDPA